MKSIVAFLIIVSLVNLSCDRDKRLHFPYVPVNMTLGLHSDLGGLGSGEVRFYSHWGGGPVGVRGIIIYKSEIPDDIGRDIFYAFDRACTFEPDFSCAVDTIGSLQGVVECPCCESRYFLIFEGDVFKGPATFPLIRYNTFIDGSFLRVVN